MTKLALLMSLLLLSSAGIEAKTLHRRKVERITSSMVIPPPPASIGHQAVDDLTFRDQCALVMYRHLVEQKGNDIAPDELAKLSFDYADSMQKVRDGLK